MVANKFLEEIEMDDSMKLETVNMCKHFHESVRLTSERYDFFIIFEDIQFFKRYISYRSVDSMIETEC